MTKNYIFFLFILLLNTGCSNAQKDDCSYKGGKPDYLSVLKCPKDFEFLEGQPLAEKFGNVKAIKVIYDIRAQKLYYVCGSKYKYHWDFCWKYLRYYHEEELISFCQVEYSDQPSRRYILGNLNHYEGSDIFTLEFFCDDKVPPYLITRLFEAVRISSYFGRELKLLINTEEIADKIESLALPSINIDSLYQSQVYQPMNKAFCYGYLRKVSVKDFDDYTFKHRDIILTDGLPNNFPLVQGIITSQFQTPLCHLNLLSNNRGTPNAALKTAWTSPQFEPFLNKLVYYEVTNDSIFIRPATEAQASTHWKNTKNIKKRNLAQDTSIRTLIDVKELNWKKAKIVGTKAANFGELRKIKSISGSPVSIPEGGFAIPFYFYNKHIQANHLQTDIDKIIQYSQNAYDRNELKKMLEDLRHKITSAPINATLLKLVENKIKQTSYKEYRFRSSTNAEDIDGFNGAGLYDSKTGILDSKEKKTIEKAIKKVWASTWNIRAFEERMYFGIDQKQVAMGILCHRAFGDESANGVAITRHLYRNGYPAFTINVQDGETSVVLPTDSITCEQFTINFNEQITGKGDFGVEYISKSSLLPSGKNVLSHLEITTLLDALNGIKRHFYSYTNYGYREPGLNSFDNYALDIEFKFDKQSRRLYVKQVRMFH